MRPPLNIVSLVTSLYVGGDANRLYHFARAVDPRRIRHTVLVLVPPNEERDAAHGPMLQHFRDAGIRVECMAEVPRSERRGRFARKLADPLAFLRIVRSLRRYLRNHAVDVLDARMNYAILLGVLAGRLARVPVVGTEYGTEFWSSSFRRWIANPIFRRLDALILDSRAKLETFQTWLTRPHPRAVVVPNGIATPESVKTRSEMLRALDLPSETGVRVIAQVSRLISYKGHHTLLDAAAVVLAREPRAAFLLCGYPHPDERFREELLEHARSLGIAHRVRITGYPGPIADVWKAVDIHVHASHYDSAPIAIHESMALGLPAVATAVGGIPDLIDDEATGLLVPPNDAGSLARALLRLLGDRALCVRLGAAARTRFEARHRPEAMATALAELFETVHASSARARPKRAARRREACHAAS